ncbi:Hypothetical predicted protein [Mytilus galloprovincialis]|uniref:Ig-like domain-containing protein n=1 Tax=Mytilus galloprovincialis TaxID=29158 RepID=A0A8B6GAC2_MYTGA|nr:Hypothetical predicted protein [Mytilus galloprovincialis]
MSLFLKLLVFPLVLTNFQRLIVEGGYITWEVMDVPLVFGDNVTIRCTYHNRLSCTDHVFWTWTTGKENELIMTNGTLSEKYKNGKKYSERRSSCTQHSILVISNLSEIDYKKKYKCGIVKINSPENSFVQYPKEEITFENLSYEYLTTESNLVDISPVEDLTTESNLFVSTVEDLTTERNFVDISLLKGFYLAAIIFVGVFYTLYPVSVMVVMIRLYYASKGEFLYIAIVPLNS